MNFQKSVRLSLGSVLLIVGVLGAASDAAAQAGVGAGPLTASLPDDVPTVGVLSVGPVKLAPGIIVRQLGWDDNVFDETESESPKEDYVIAAMPDISIYTRMRLMRLAAYAGSELTYYKTYDSERSAGHALRGRVDFLLSRVRPFVGWGQTRTRERPNGEIDTRADRLEQELSSGVAFDISEHSLFYGAAYQMDTTYEDSLEEGVDLGQALSRTGYNYQGGLKTDLTPLLSMQLFASYQEDKFRDEPIRNGIGKSFTAVFGFDPEAIITGTATASYQDSHYADPGVKPFRGFVGNAQIAYRFLEFGRFNLLLQRGLEYSFDIAEAYYVENTGNLSYTHRLYGEVDLQAGIARSLFDYSARLTEPPHKDTLDTASGSLGYNLRNRTRVALNYEYTRRRSPAFSARNYQRRRVYLSWLFAF